MTVANLSDVSRETLQDLQSFAEYTRKWSSKINLVSKSDRENLWTRHVLDSLQIIRWAEPCGHWVDLGSGGGFPALVLAIYARRDWPHTRFTLIESDARKAVFLRTVIREFHLNAQVKTNRIEDTEPQKADILTARALADLTTLLGFAERHLSETGYALFQKGASWKKEVEDAQKTWRFDFEPFKSETDGSATILKVQGVSRD